MTTLDNPATAASMFAAVSHLLTGEHGRTQELNDHIAIIVGTAARSVIPRRSNACARQAERPVVRLISDREDISAGAVLTISVTCVIDGRRRQYARCEPWLAAGGSIAQLVPDDYGSGAFVVGGDLELSHVDRPPAPDAFAAGDGVERALVRLGRLREQHAANPTELWLPSVWTMSVGR